MDYYSQDFAGTDFRQHPELYRVGKGEQGVLSVEPYKSEILPFWRFATPDAARQTMLLTEPTLRRLWDTPAEDEAWRDL